MQVHGDLSAVLSEVDTLVSREGAGPKDIADAAMALTYLQARGDRRSARLCFSSALWLSPQQTWRKDNCC